MSILINYRLLIPLVVMLGLAPFYPQPHIFEKVALLMEGSLRKPIDIFDLLLHALPFVLLLCKGGGDLLFRK